MLPGLVVIDSHIPGQDSSKQARVCVVFPSQFPHLFDAVLEICLVRDFTPPCSPPHFEHDDQPLQGPISQSPGQAWLLQDFHALSPKHAPPFNAGFITGLVWVLSPHPHDLEQDDHSPQSPNSQSTGPKTPNFEFVLEVS